MFEFIEKVALPGKKDCHGLYISVGIPSLYDEGTEVIIIGCQT